jgi:predicted signal transduction protein with EAL and GGDEF domain
LGFTLQRQAGDAPLRWRMIARELALQLAILPTLAVITLTLFDRAALLPLLVASPILALRVAAAADTRRRAAEKRLGLDPLTQLSNHERFWRRLDSELEVPGARVAVVLLDVDD